MISILAISLALTLAVEVPVAFCWGLRRRDLLLCMLVNLLTNPAVVLLHTLFPAVWITAALEAAAVGAEGFYYSRFGADIRRPWALALAANLLSYSAGVLLNLLF